MFLFYIQGGCSGLAENGVTNTGLFAYCFQCPGIYYFEISNNESVLVTTVVTSSKQNDHKITITDNNASPKVLDIYPDDRVWFVWDETRKARNIRQVNYSNEILPDGFLSGSLIDSPGMYLQMFNELGIYYYRSDNLNEILGAIAVIPESSVTFNRSLKYSITRSFDFCLFR